MDIKHGHYVSLKNHTKQYYGLFSDTLLYVCGLKSYNKFMIVFTSEDRRGIGSAVRITEYLNFICNFYFFHVRNKTAMAKLLLSALDGGNFVYHLLAFLYFSKRHGTNQWYKISSFVGKGARCLFTCS